MSWANLREDVGSVFDEHARNVFDVALAAYELRKSRMAQVSSEHRVFGRNGVVPTIGRPKSPEVELARDEKKRRRAEKARERSRQAAIAKRGGAPKKAYVLTPEQREWAKHNGLTATETARQLGVSARGVRAMRATYASNLQALVSVPSSETN
ncbi:MAG: hypothetical protein RLZZ450_76 [Pseudomonadota bacterium]|jgi:hypothetical protein